MKQIINKIQKFGIIETIIFEIYTLLIIFVAINHECWMDESQGWLIARDLNFIDIIKQMKYEAHPVLWYYLLAPFAKLGFPVQTQVYISSFFAIATAFLILKKAPFNKLTKVLLVFSGGMLFFYSIISRSYSMIPFVLVCIAIMYKERSKHPYKYAILLAILANTHLIMLPTATLLAIFFYGEELIIKRKDLTKDSKIRLYKSSLIVIISILFYVIIALIGFKNCAVEKSFYGIIEQHSIFDLPVKEYFNQTWIKYVNCFAENSLNQDYISIILIIILILCGIASFLDLKHALIFWSQVIFTFIIHMFFWYTFQIRVFTIIYTLMFWLWTSKTKEKPNIKNNLIIEFALILLVLISMPGSYKVLKDDINNEFSTGKSMANYIKQNISKDSCFIYPNTELQQSVVAYLPKKGYKFFVPKLNKFVTYTTWDQNWKINIDENDILNAIDELKNNYQKIYIILDSDVLYRYNLFNSKYSIQELFSTEGKQIQGISYIRREEYVLYEVKL